ncbi:MAG: D-alanyl-D-alanine carboxypeptidase [Hyphomonadaceae bacterium]|nr:D-alanyl-D-alanine carboxypeptidase [Hyphomonadaceae bacterium]
MLSAAAPRPSQRLLRAVTALLVALAPLIAGSSHGRAQSGDVVLKSPQAILMDADSGAVLFQRNADELVPPASMSKLMLLIMIFNALRAGEITPDTDVVMSEYAWRTGGAPSRTSAMFVPLGKTAKVDEMLRGIIVQSGNDASIAMAERLSGSERQFALAMTEQARQLGLKKSVFKNATGLYHPEHLATARELAVLARIIIKDYPEYYPLFAQREFAYRQHKFFNRNPLLGAVAGVDGLKTGYVKEAGYGIAASAKVDNRRLIMVIGGATTPEERKDDGRRLFEWGFKNFSEVKLFEAGEVVGHARIWGGERMYMPLTGDNGVNVVLPRYPANQKLSGRIFYKGPLKPPIKKGDQVAILRVTTSSDAMNEVPLFAAEDVGKAGFVRRGLDSLLYLATGWMR